MAIECRAKPGRTIAGAGHSGRHPSRQPPAASAPRAGLSGMSGQRALQIGGLQHAEPGDSARPAHAADDRPGPPDPAHGARASSPTRPTTPVSGQRSMAGFRAVTQRIAASALGQHRRCRQRRPALRLFPQAASPEPGAAAADRRRASESGQPFSVRRGRARRDLGKLDPAALAPDEPDATEAQPEHHRQPVAVATAGAPMTRSTSARRARSSCCAMMGWCWRGGPMSDDFIGQNVARPPEIGRQLSDQRYAEPLPPSQTIDGVTRIISYQRAGDTPLVTVVALSVADVLARWRQDLARRFPARRALRVPAGAARADPDPVRPLARPLRPASAHDARPYGAGAADGRARAGASRSTTSACSTCWTCPRRCWPAADAGLRCWPIRTEQGEFGRTDAEVQGAHPARRDRPAGGQLRAHAAQRHGARGPDHAAARWRAGADL